jgi:D-alanine--poly(phosphoribitol) ligase subunit 2
MMERLYEILEDIQPGVNYKECENLIDGHFLDSLSIIALVAELEDEYDITIPAVEIIPANFNSAKAMWKMIQRLEEVD